MKQKKLRIIYKIATFYIIVTPIGNIMFYYLYVKE